MLKLILADNQAIFRAGIAKVLAVEDEMRIVAQAQTQEQMFMALDKFRAAVLIVAGGFHSDFNAVLQSANRNKTRVVVLADTGESAQRYMGAGSHGVVYRNVTSAALVDCVRKVARGETWVQDIAVPSELTENDMVGLRVRDRLTAKELRIVALIVQGYKNKEIASQLGTTEQVIKNYLRNVYDKIGVSDRLELALFTIHHRILNEAACGRSFFSLLEIYSVGQRFNFNYEGEYAQNLLDSSSCRSIGHCCNRADGRYEDEAEGKGERQRGYRAKTRRNGKVVVGSLEESRLGNISEGPDTGIGKRNCHGNPGHGTNGERCWQF